MKNTLKDAQCVDERLEIINLAEVVCRYIFHLGTKYMHLFLFVSDVVDLRGRSPSPHKMLLPGYHLTHHQRRLSIDEANIRSNRKENSFLPILPKSQEESTGNGKHSPSPAQSPSKSSSSPKKRNSKKNRRKSRDFNISVLPAFMGGKKRIPAKLNELADEKRLDTPPQVHIKRLAFFVVAMIALCNSTASICSWLAVLEKERENKMSLHFFNFAMT